MNFRWKIKGNQVGSISIYLRDIHSVIFIPGQKIHPCLTNWDLVIPWWNWCNWCSILSLSEGGTTRAPPWRTRPSSTVRVSWCCQLGCKGWETSLMSSGQAVMMMSVRACISGSLMKACWNTSFWSEDRWPWWMAISSGMLGPGCGLKWERDHAWPFPYWGGNGECSHSPGGTVTCAAAGLACLPGSSWRWIPRVFGLIQW